MLSICEVEYLFFNYYGFSADEVEDLIESHEDTSILLVDTLIHELRHAEVILKHGWEHELNDEELVTQYGADSAKESYMFGETKGIVKEYNIKDVIGFHNSHREYFEKRGFIEPRNNMVTIVR